MAYGKDSAPIDLGPERAGRSSLAGPPRQGRGFEWQTALLAMTIYGGWLVLTAYAHRLPTVVIVLAGGWLIAWHGSLQHEVIHGHPSRWPWLNTLIGAIPLSLWLPFGIYRRLHIAHHATPEITDPLEDSESRYLRHDRSLKGRLRNGVERAQATLIGRLVLGPAIMVTRFFVEELTRLWREPIRTGRHWCPISQPLG
jgi:fatty acid desaturase